MSDTAPSAAPEPARADDDAIRQRVREARAALALAAHEQALRAIEGTPGGADTRARRQVPADRAGETYTAVHNTWLAKAEADELLSYRQSRAAEHLLFLFRLGGGKHPWVRGYGAEDAPEAGEIAAARVEWSEHLAAVSAVSRDTIWNVLIFEMPNAPETVWLPPLRDGLDVVANRLRYPT